MRYSILKIASLGIWMWAAVLPAWGAQRPNTQATEIQVVHPIMGHSQAEIDNPVTIKGFIKDFYLVEYKYPGGPVRILGLKLETPDGLVYRVHLAPPGFFADKGWRLSAGDIIQLTGVFTQVNQGLTLITDKISWQGNQLSLRDNRGIPKWDYNQEVGSFYRK